jgi:RNA polymerase sigma-70 factor (ECF subfamily)
MNKTAEVQVEGWSAVSDDRESRVSDRRLLRAVRKGSGRAIEELIERHWDLAHRIAYGIVGDAHAAEDVTQEAMLSVLASIGRFDLMQPFEPWLHRIVSNRALDFLRARTRRPEGHASAFEEEHAGLGDERLAAAGRVSSAGDPARAADGDPALVAALATLSPDHRAIVVLRFVAGYGPKEIGRLLGIPTGTVGSRLRRAMDQLRIEMEDHDG